MRLALIVEYEGANYHGFQYQVNASSIQEELERAITRFTGETVRVKAAGRTDAGVHAKGQVVAFDTEARYSPDVVVGALNFYLPKEIAVRAAYGVSDMFDPRRDALSRKYRYTVLNSQVPSPLMRGVACFQRKPLDTGKMKRAARLLLGRHDFSRFSGPLIDGEASTERYVYNAVVQRDGEVVTFDVEGSSFLPHQVRRMAGSLVGVGGGRLSIEEFRLMIDGGCDSAVAHSLPSHGLCLMEVTYADFPPKAGAVDGNE